MAATDFFDNDGFDQSLDVSASTRKFQSSVVVKQDSDKSGILSFLTKVEKTSPTRPLKSDPPTKRQGIY